MRVAFIVGERPTKCKLCPLFVKNYMGYPPYCRVGGKYTDEEVKLEKDGALKMYYHGYLDRVPNNCPLVEI